MSWSISRVGVWAAVLLGVLSGLAARTARADTPAAAATPVYVLAVWTDDADDQADALTRALRSRVRQAQGWSLQETNQSFETLAIALKCPPKPDAACLLRIGDQLKASDYVWGTLAKNKGEPGEVAADLHLWRRGKPGIETRGVLSDNLKDPNDEGLRSIAGDLFNQLTAAASPRPIPTAAIVAAAPATAPAGERTGAYEPDLSTPHDTLPAGSEQRFTARTALAYTTLALGIGLLAAATVEAASWISDNNASIDDRRLVPTTVSDVCTDRMTPAAADACNKSSDATKASTLGWIFAGGGAGLVVTGLWLLVTDHAGARAHDETHGETYGAPRASRTALDVVPSLGPTSGSVAVRLRF
jgi:hypothetical protein